jgi:SAM-dependent methyltransferase
MSGFSEFSAVDASVDPAVLVRSLDQYAEGLAAMKAYMAAAAARAVDDGLVVDVGCGAGHDLEHLAGRGVRAIGLDPSELMVRTSRDRLGPALRVTRADGAAMPFRDGAVDGCHIERVLQHVEDPAAVLAEAARVTRPGGFLAVFEPDWTSVSFASGPTGAHDFAGALARVRHPDVGRRLAGLVATAGYEVVDEVRERSFAERMSALPWRLGPVLERAAQQGHIGAPTVESWLAEQRARDANGTFRATWTKVLIVATRRDGR